MAPVTSPGQVIHGDILPNVLVADGLPPGVIDWPPYFRPVGTANAVAITDAVTFRGAPLSLLDEWETGRGLEPAAHPRPALPAGPDRHLRDHATD